jgi:hypothetical protein
MWSPILGSSDLPIIGENRCSRKWVNKTKGPKFVKITLDTELSTKIIKKNSLALTAHESQFSDKQKFHIAPKQRHPLSTEVLGNCPCVM